jgi:hypothetical protein
VPVAPVWQRPKRSVEVPYEKQVQFQRFDAVRVIHISVADIHLFDLSLMFLA